MYPKRLLHQCGHNTVWNIDCFEQDGAGDGLIFSPLHATAEKIHSFELDTRRKSFFDPQFYLPNSQKKNLASYPFFPETIAHGFSTVDYLALATDSAISCIEFQLRNDFDRLVIPSRFIDQMRSDYIDSQEAMTLVPFLDAAGKCRTEKPIYFSVALTVHMIADSGFRTSLLNWLTKHPELDGLYVCIADDRATKQIQSEEVLEAIYSFALEVRGTGLELTLGHLNTEALLLSLIESVEVTFGAYENTRIFSVDKFVVSAEERRGPKPRIYMPGLLNWIQLADAKRIKRELPRVWADIHTPTEYSEAALSSPREPTFQTPTLYKHFFNVFSDQVKRLRQKTYQATANALSDEIFHAERAYEQIAAAGLLLERHGAGDHIKAWRSFVNQRKLII